MTNTIIYSKALTLLWHNKKLENLWYDFLASKFGL